MATERIRKPRVDVSTPIAAPHVYPTYVAGTVSEIGGVEWSVSLFSDDTVKIHVNGARSPAAVGRFVTSTHRTEYGYSVSADIVDVSPEDVSAEILRDLSSNLTFFAMRAGRFSGGKVA